MVKKKMRKYEVRYAKACQSLRKYERECDSMRSVLAAK